MQLPSDDFGCPPPIPLLCADSELADIAIDNAIDLAEHISILALRWDREYRFTPDIICECNHIAMRGIYECAGKFRDRIVLVGNFVPPAS